MRDVLRKRSDILQSITADWYTKPGLDEEMSISRSTIDRGIDELLEAGLIARDGSSFRVTERDVLRIGSTSTTPRIWRRSPR
jgi:predicted transcriptional regulator